MSNILILIPSFDNKHTINVTVYIEFDVCAQEKNVNRCTWKNITYQYLKLEE